MNSIKDYQTAEQWFKDLKPLALRAKALANIKKVAEKRPKTAFQTYPTLRSAVKQSFPWYSTPEGYIYWKEVAKNLK